MNRKKNAVVSVLIQYTVENYTAHVSLLGDVLLFPGQQGRGLKTCSNYNSKKKVLGSPQDLGGDFHEQCGA